MSITRRVVAVIFTAITSLGALWLALGWASMIMKGASWSDLLAMMAISPLLLVLSLISAALWGSHVRWAAYLFLVVAALAAVSFFGSAF